MMGKTHSLTDFSYLEIDMKHCQNYSPIHTGFKSERTSTTG